MRRMSGWRARRDGIRERLARSMRPIVSEPGRTGPMPIIGPVPEQPPDPFEPLRLQLSLARLAAEVERQRADDQGYARAHHVRAAVVAYDDLLEEACRVTGVVLPRMEAGPWRIMAEAELQARGWEW